MPPLPWDPEEHKLRLKVLHQIGRTVFSSPQEFVIGMCKAIAITLVTQSKDNPSCTTDEVLGEINDLIAGYVASAERIKASVDRTITAKEN